MICAHNDQDHDGGLWDLLDNAQHEELAAANDHSVMSHLLDYSAKRCFQASMTSGVTIQRKRRRFARRIYPYGTGCVVSGKAEQKAHTIGYGTDNGTLPLGTQRL